MDSEKIENTSEVQKMSFGQKFLGIFNVQPAVFENLRLYPDWLIPVVIIILVSIITIMTTTDLQLAAQREFIDSSEMIPEDRKVDMLDQLENQGWVRTKLIPSVGGIFAIFIYYAVMAAAFLLFGNFIFGGSASFKQMFALVSWGSLIGLLEMAIKLPLMLSKGTMQVYTSLALLMDTSESKSVLFNILDAVDVFTIWKIIVFSVGFAIIYKFSKGKGYTAVITLFLIYLILKIGLSQLFQGFIS